MKREEYVKEIENELFAKWSQLLHKNKINRFSDTDVDRYLDKIEQGDGEGQDLYEFVQDIAYKLLKQRIVPVMKGKTLDETFRIMLEDFWSKHEYRFDVVYEFHKYYRRMTDSGFVSAQSRLRACRTTVRKTARKPASRRTVARRTATRRTRRA